MKLVVCYNIGENITDKLVNITYKCNLPQMMELGPSSIHLFNYFDAGLDHVVPVNLYYQLYILILRKSIRWLYHHKCQFTKLIMRFKED